MGAWLGSPRLRRVVEDGGWLAISQLGVLVARVASLKALTTLMDPGAFGEVVLFLGVATFASTLFFQPLQSAALRFYADAARDGRIRALRAMASATLRKAGILVGCVLFAAAGARLLRGGGPGQAASLVALAILVCADAWRLFEANLLNAARRQKAFSLWNIGDAWGRAIFSVVAVLLAGPASASVLGGQAAACLIVASLALPIAKPDRGGIEPALDRDWTIRHAGAYRAYFRPLVPMALLGWIVGVSDRYFIAAFAGVADAGVYGAAYGLASQGFLASSMVLTLFFRPILFDAVARRDSEKVRAVVRTWCLVALGVGAAGVGALALFGPFLMRLLTGPEFQRGAPLLPVIGAAYALQGLQTVGEIYLYAVGRTGRLLVLQAASAAAAVALYVAWIPGNGAEGAARATLGSFVVSVVLAAALAARSGRGRAVDAR